MKFEKLAFSVLMAIGLQQQLCGASENQHKLLSLVKDGDIAGVNKFGQALPSLNFALIGVGSPLIYAIQQGHNQIVQLLLQRGADANFTSFNGFVPLVRAMQWGNRECVRILLEAGVDPNGYGTGNSHTCVFHAANYSPEMLDMLVDAGGDLDKNLYGPRATPLMFACWVGNRVATLNLVRAGAALEIKNYDGFTALQLPFMNREDIVQLLVDRGAEYRESRYDERNGFKAKMVSHYHRRGQSIQDILENERGLPRDVSRLVCVFAAVPKGQMPGKPQYNAYKIDRTCWGTLKRMYRYLCPEKEKRQ